VHWFLDHVVNKMLGHERMALSIPSLSLLFSGLILEYILEFFLFY
jgi:hypothetical protein